MSFMSVREDLYILSIDMSAVYETMYLHVFMAEG